MNNICDNSNQTMFEAQPIDFKAAYECRDLEQFMRMVFPSEWSPIIARIIETGAEFGDTDVFAPRWTCIPFTERKGATPEETWLKSVIFRVHDCLHQLWGLPIPRNFDDTTRRFMKRTLMCAEVTVLTLVEFFYCKWLYDTQPSVRLLLEKRNTLLFKETTDLRFKTMEQTAARLDELMHKKRLPQWVRENKYGVEFCRDYVPMLEQDRRNINHNWELLQVMSDEKIHLLRTLPDQRYSTKLNGLEFTLGMIQDFKHILAFTGDEIDRPLAEFNKSRRCLVNVLPPEWNQEIGCDKCLNYKAHGEPPDSCGWMEARMKRMNDDELGGSVVKPPPTPEPEEPPTPPVWWEDIINYLQQFKKETWLSRKKVKWSGEPESFIGFMVSDDTVWSEKFMDAFEKKFPELEDELLILAQSKDDVEIMKGLIVNTELGKDMLLKDPDYIIYYDDYYDAKTCENKELNLFYVFNADQKNEDPDGL